MEAAYDTLDNLIHHIERNLDVFLSELKRRAKDKFTSPLAAIKFPGHDRPFIHAIKTLNEKMAQVLHSEIYGIDYEIGNLKRERDTLAGR